MIPIHFNALAALLILSGMFGGLMYLFMQVLQYLEALGCSGTEFGLMLLALIGGCTAGVIWVCKYFARRNSKGEIIEDDTKE